MATEPDNHEPNELFNAFSEAFDGYCVGLFELDAVRAALGRVLELELTSIGAATSLIHKAFQEDIIKARTYEALINDIDLAASEEDPTEWSEDTRSEIEQEKACANAVFDNTNPDLEDELETPEPKLPSSPSIEIIYTDLPPPDDSDGPSSDNTATETENKAEKSLTLGPGSILADRYELVSLIGNGSMGDIYEAIDRESQASGIEDPRVAIKVISQSFSKHSNALATLQYEADNSRKMVHQNIVSVLGADWDEDRFFMIMELLEGQSLGSMLTEAGSQPLPHPQARDIIASL
ncbi:MAG: protein kinase, partial [Gammaproteobacteria bacterium]|nr:protein kinase [Gammaproteobacteria bacterium]